jgi:hypothetical protein
VALVVSQAPTTTSATLSSSSINLGSSVYLNYEVSSDYGISGNTMYGSTTVSQTSGPSGGSAGCVDGSSNAITAISQAQSNDDGTVAKGGFDYFADGSNNTTHRFTCTPTMAGTYVIAVSFTDNPATGTPTPNDGNYANSASAGQTLTVILNVLPPTSFTSEGLCPFRNGSTADQFRLIYTPDLTSGTGKYKLNASNPGQFSYNIAYNGSGPADVSLPSWVTNWFVTQGAMPVKIYDGGTVLTNGCVQPGNLITSETLNTGGTSLHVPALSGSGAYITIHLDYKYKGFSNCTKGLTDSASCLSPSSSGSIVSPKTYATIGTHTITSVNIFKNDPGIGGLFTQGGNPVQGASVQIKDGSGNMLATVTTDQDGWYMWNYKYTGKAATFTVTLQPPYSGTQTVTLKSNSFLVVNFIQ